MLTAPFQPDTPEAEQTAWAAGLSLNDPPENFDTPLPDGRTPRAIAGETYRQYFEYRTGKGLEPFPTMRAQSAAAMQGEFRKAYGGLDKLPENLKPEQWQQLEEGGKGELDPQEFHARAINANFFKSMLGRDVEPENLSDVRDAYARQELGLQGEITDKAVYLAIQKRNEQDEADAKAFTGIVEGHISRRLDTMGKVDTTAPTPQNHEIKGFDRPGPPLLEWKPTLEDRDKALAVISERNRPAFRAKWNESQREINRLAAKAKPLVDHIVGVTEKINSDGDPDELARILVNQWAAELPQEPKERAMVLALLGNKLSNLPPDQRSAMQRIGQSIKRGMVDAAYSGIQATMAEGRQAVRALPYGDPNNAGEALSDDAFSSLSTRRELLNIIQGNGMKLSDAADNYLTRAFVAAAPSAWMFPAAFSPVGQLAIVQTMTGDSIQKSTVENPDLPEGLRTNAALASGMAQAVIETVSNTRAAKIMLGKLPTFTAALNKLGLASPTGRAAAGFAAGAAATSAMEYTEEALQGGTDMLFQGLAADLAGQKPDIDWSGYFKDWATAAGPEQQETLLAVSAFGMIAGAGAGFHHFKYGAALQRNKTFLRANGLSEAEVRDVVATTDAEAASQKAAAYFDLAQARGANATPEEKARLSDLRKEAIAVLKASNEAWAAAGMPRVEKEHNDFTGEDQHVFIDPVTGSRKAFETEEDALGAWQDWNSEQSEDAIQSIREAGEAGFLDHLTAEGSATEGVNVERVNKTVTPATEMAAAQADVTAAETDQRKAITPAQERKAREKVEAAKERLGRIKSRVELFLLERGIDPTNATAVGRALDSVVIKAKSFATILQGRVVGYTVQLFNGAQIQDIAEDFSETAMKMAVESGFAAPEIILDDIRRYEAASGNRVIDPAYQYDPANPLPLIEGFSKLARGVLMGNVRSGLLPPEVSAWIEMQAALMAVSADLAKQGDQLSMDVRTAAELRQAIAAGQVPGRMERLLRDSLGLDPEAQNRRLEKKMEEQLAAEAMGGFPEISEEMKGRLPHPETLRENSHPLYGKVRRIWESLKKPTNRRTKDGKTVDRVNEANAYFLPVGTMEDLDHVREAMNEKGFAFDTITDMLDALDVSISYGKPVYGTRRNESFAIGRSTVQPSVETQTFQGADGSPSVIGPASFSLGPSDYGIGHRPSEEGPRAFDLAENDMMPADVYDHPEWYSGMGKKIIDETMRQLRAVKGKADALLTIYRAGPVGKMNSGDWVSLSKEYARTHADSQDPEGYKVWQAKVKASDVRWPMDDLAEFGYFGEATDAKESDVSFSIGAWHGTPHKVDKFSTDKIGTGEGAQAYGWGLYFAEAKALAERYRYDLAGVDAGTPTRQEGEDIRAHDAARRALEGADGDKQTAIERMETRIRVMNNPRSYENLPLKVLKLALKIIKKSEPKKLGNLYRVTLKVEDEDLLDWDNAPISLRNENDLESGPIPQKMAVDLLGWGDVSDEDSFLSAIEFAEREFAPGGETSLRSLYHQDKDPYSTEKRDWWAAAYVNAAATGQWVYARLSSGEWKSNGAAFAGDGKSASEILQKAGIRGIRYLDGNSRGADGEGSYNYVIFDGADIEILEENGQPVSLKTENLELATSFAMSTPGLLRLEAAIAKRMTRGPDERAEYFQRLRDRLASTVLMLRESKRNIATDQTDTERERNRIRDAVAEASAIIKALPMEARGRVPFNVNDILDADTERDQINGLIRLIDKADEALETVLLKEYREAFETLLDLAKPALRQNKQVRGRLTPETQRMVGKILHAVTLTPAELAIAIPAKQAEIDTLEATQPQTPEEIAAAQKALVELYQEQTVLETFGAFSTLDAAQTAHAYEQLQSIYITGRTTRRILDEAKQEEIKAARKELLASLPSADQAKHAERTADKGFMDMANAFRLGMSSFHQVMEDLFPRSTVARDFQDQVRKADRAFVRAKLAAKDRFDRFTFAAWNLSGPSRSRKRNRILADLSTLRTDWGIQLQEGITFASEKLTEEQAAAIADGTMKTGWETDPIAMTSLRQALADFRMQRLKAQNEDKRFTATVIKFQRLTNRGTPGPFVASDLQALYFLQLYAQEQYRPALDKFGFTESVIESIEKKINPKAKDLGDFLRDEYDAEWGRLNPVYRAIYGLDMPKIRNYAPGMFEHLDAKSGSDSTIDPYGAQSSVNAMSAGFTKARTHHMARPKLTNAMAGYWSHLEATEYFIAYAEIMRDARQIFRHPEVRRRIEGQHGTKVASLFSQWLDALEVDGNFKATEMLALAETAHKTLATQSAVGLAYNVGVLFKQASAMFGVLLEMPHKDAAVGLARAIANPGSLKHVWNSEAVQQRVMAGISPEDRKLIDAGKASPSLIMEMLEVGRLPIAYADAAFTTMGASVAYNYHLGEALKAGLSPAAAESSALAAASRVIERTAQPARAQDKSMAELTAKGVGKFMFMFKSDPRQKLAISMNSIVDVKRGKTGAKSKAARKLLWGWLIYGTMNELMTDIWAQISRDDDDPERWSWRDYLAAMIAGPIGGLPLLGGTAEYAIRATIGTKGYISGMNPVEQGASRVIPATKKAAEMLSGEEEVSTSDMITASQQAASAMALVAGAFDPRAALLPAGMRVVRDAVGTMTNFASLFMEPTADDMALEIVREIAADQKTTRDGKADALDQLAKDLGKLPATDRQQRLAKLDADTRSSVTRKLRAAQMTASEAALSKLTKENSSAAVEKITAGMSAADKAAYVERLQSLGLD